MSTRVGIELYFHIASLRSAARVASRLQIPLPVQGEGKRVWRARVRAASTQSLTSILIARSARLRTSAPPGDLLPRPTFSRIVNPSRGLCHPTRAPFDRRQLNLRE